MCTYFEFYDRLSGEDIFTNGISGKTADIEAYMTVCDFNKLTSFLLLAVGEYSPEEWKDIMDNFEFRGYLSPMNRIIARYMQRVAEWKGK